MPRLRLILATLAALLLCAAAPAPNPGTGPGPAVGSNTGLPVPRFVSLRSDDVNVRAGPGFQYPVNWVYKRAGLPVEIIGEFNVWRHIIAPDGGTGWLHEATIRARRTFYVTATQAMLYSAPRQGANVVAYLDKGVTGDILHCDGDSAFCKVKAGHKSGYLARTDFWGTFPGETVK